MLGRFAWTTRSLPIVLCERSHHVHVGGERIWDLRALSAAARLRSPHTTKTQNKKAAARGGGGPMKTAIGRGTAGPEGMRGAIDGTVRRTRKRISPDLIGAPSDLAPLFGSRASFHHPFPSHDTFSTYKASLLSPSIRSQMTQHMSPMRQTPFAISSE